MGTVSKEDIALDHASPTFGKHKGRTPDVVSEHDPGWLVWAHQNVKDKKVCSETLYKACVQDSAKARYIKKDRGLDEFDDLRFLAND